MPDKPFDENFRAGQIGKPSFVTMRRDYSKVIEEAQASIKQYEQDRIERLKGRVYRPIIAVRISEDYGKTWKKLLALCDECVRNIEPPVQRRKEGAAGVNYCDWCGAMNEMYEEKK